MGLGVDTACPSAVVSGLVAGLRLADEVDFDHASTFLSATVVSSFRR
jgi:hypothetical protein